MATNMAVSVPGRIGTHRSAKVAALSVCLGSTDTILAPASLAWARYQQVLVPVMVLAGSQPHMIINLELTRSSRVLLANQVP